MNFDFDYTMYSVLRKGKSKQNVTLPGPSGTPHKPLFLMIRSIISQKITDYLIFWKE